MDFVTYRSRLVMGCDAKWGVVDQLTKNVHFLSVS